MAPFPWIDGPHHDLIFDALERVERRECLRLIINIPPGYGKSFDCSRIFPTWVLLRHPEWEFLLTSYGDDLAEEHSAAARQFYRYWAPKITGGALDPRSEAVDRWLVMAGPESLGGGMRAVGINSAVTGRRADIALIDDPYKNWKEASSFSQREMVYKNYQSAIRNRLRPRGAIVIIHTRWHQDDITGRLVEEMVSGTGEQFEVLKLPARAMSDDPLGRNEGDPLWPAFYDDDELVKMEMATGHFFWMSQHQQCPESPEGKMFKRAWLRHFTIDGDYYCLGVEAGTEGKRVHRSGVLIFQTVDTNGSAKTSADYFVCSTFGVTGDGDLLLLDVYREHIGVESHLEVLTSCFGRWSPGAQYVEDKTYGTNLIAAALAAGLPVFGVGAEDDKLTRSIVAMTKYRSGKVFHLKFAPWLAAVEHELLEFPGGKYDDFVDSVSIAGIQSVELAGWSAAISVGGVDREGMGYGISAGSGDIR